MVAVWPPINRHHWKIKIRRQGLGGGNGNSEASKGLTSVAFSSGTEKQQVAGRVIPWLCLGVLILKHRYLLLVPFQGRSEHCRLINHCTHWGREPS